MIMGVDDQEKTGVSLPIQITHRKEDRSRTAEAALTAESSFTWKN